MYRILIFKYIFFVITLYCIICELPIPIHVYFAIEIFSFVAKFYAFELFFVLINIIHSNK